MKNLIPKLIKVYLPFLLASVVFLVFYTFLNWLLVIKLEWITVNEIYVNFGAPMVLAAIVTFMWVRPRLHQLKLKNRQGKNWIDFYSFVAGIALLAPVLVAQAYLKTATGRLTQLQNAGQIAKHEKTRYYRIKNFYVYKEGSGVYRYNELSGRYNENLEFNIYVACPVYSSEKQTVAIPRERSFTISKGKKVFVLLDGQYADSATLSSTDPKNVKSVDVFKGPAAVSIFGKEAVDGLLVITTKNARAKSHAAQTPDSWLGVKYHLQVSSRLSDAEKEERYKTFNQQSFADYNRKELTKFNYLERLGNTDERKYLDSAIRSLKYSATYNPVILEAIDEPFAARNGNKLQWIFESFGIGAVVWLIMVLIPGYRGDLPPVSKTRKKLLMKKSWRDNLTFFIPRPGFYVTPIIVDLNLLVFMAMIAAGFGFVSFDTQSLLTWGANYRPYTANGQWWRLLTNTFMHGGIMHVLMNMFSLVIVGAMLEPLLGYKRYLTAYLISGIAASLTSMYWHNTISVGASGAVFGLYGVFAALLFTPLFARDQKKSFAGVIGVFIGYNLLFGLAPGIDNAAHIGGLISGILFGFMMYPILKQKANEKVDADHDGFDGGVFIS